MSVGDREEIDQAFNLWFNQSQPIQAIMEAFGRQRLTADQTRDIRIQIKQAFVHGYARGVAAEAAQPLPDHPELGSVR